MGTVRLASRPEGPQIRQLSAETHIFDAIRFDCGTPVEEVQPVLFMLPDQPARLSLIIVPAFCFVHLDLLDGRGQFAPHTSLFRFQSGHLGADGTIIESGKHLVRLNSIKQSPLSPR